MAEQYFNRYGLPMMLTETNLRGLPSDRISWLRYMVEQYEHRARRGVPLHGFCWFPQVDSCDWDSLLARAAGRVDPVGVVSIDAGTKSRRRTGFTEAWEKVAAGARARRPAGLPVPTSLRRQLRGFVPAWTDWPWQDPPDAAGNRRRRP